MNPLQRSRTSLVLAVLAAAGLGYDAYVHLHLAAGYDPVGSTVTQGWLFRPEAALALAGSLAVLLSDRRLAWAAAGLAGLGGAVAVVLYRYVDVGAFGPLPDMYEPAWYPLKTRSAVAEAAVAVLWVVREVLRRRATAASAAGSPARPVPAGRPG